MRILTYLLHFSLFAFFSLFQGIAITQVFTEIPGINQKLNYSFVSDDLSIAVIGGVAHYKTTDQGITWTAMNNGIGSGLYQVEGFNVGVSSASTMCVIGQNTSDHTYVIVRTDDGGATWSSVLSVSSWTDQLKDIAAQGDYLVATAKNGIYRSADSGLSWSYVPLSTGGEISSFVRYNAAADSWIVGGYSSYFHVSSDGGETWNELNLGFPASEVIGATRTGGGVLLSRTIATGTQLVFLQAANIPNVGGIVPKQLLMTNLPSKAGSFMPDGSILTYNPFVFYKADTSNQHVYCIDYPTASGYNPTSLSLGSTYGVAHGYSPGWGTSKAYLIDLTQTSSMYVPSNFEIAGPGPCAGDPIISVGQASYADSVKWYVNNVLVSTADGLNYPTLSNMYMNYILKRYTYYNGLSDLTTKTIIMSPPQAPHTFTYIVDTTACYGQPLHVFIDPNPGIPSNTGVHIKYNGQFVDGPITMNQYNIHLYTPPLTESGTLEIITYKTPYCDPSADTVTLHIEVGPNLLGFEVLAHDSVICTGVDPMLHVSGTNPLYAYDFHATYSILSFAPTEITHYQTLGDSIQTLEIPYSGLSSSLNRTREQAAYGNIYTYLHVQVADVSGCVSSKILDTIRVQRPTAMYERHSRSFLRGDTVHLSNAYVTDNRLWSSQTLNPASISNPTAEIPLIHADTTGFFDLTLRNEPLAGCVDSFTCYVHYADPAPNSDTACVVKTLHPNEYLHRVRIDQFGNIYEVSAYAETMHSVPLYVLRKSDAFGHILWEKKAVYTGWAYQGITGIAIEEIDFDSEGNPIIAMWIEGRQDFHNAYFDFTPNWWEASVSWCYVAKVDQETGELMWRVKLNDLPEGPPGNRHWRITDLVVDGDRIYVSTYGKWELTFYTLDSRNGNFIHASEFDFGVWMNEDFISPNFLVSSLGSGSDSRESFWSPQLDVLSTGEVIAIGHYNSFYELANHPELTPVNSTAGIFALKYSPENGIYDVRNIAQTGHQYDAYFTGVNIPYMFVDKRDQITVAANWQYGFYDETEIKLIKVLDSTLQTKTGTFIFNMDKDYQLNWLSTGTNGTLSDLTYAAATDETYLLSSAKNNFSMGTNMTHLMQGMDEHMVLTYENLPYDQYPWLDYAQSSGFLTCFDDFGNPRSMKKIEHSSDGMHFQTFKADATPCGDLALVYRGWEVEVDGVNYAHGDSAHLFLYYTNCTSADCSYLNAPDTLKLCTYEGITEIALSDYYNLDTVSYDLLINGETLVQGQSSQVVNGKFPLSVPAAANEIFSIAFGTPTVDTLVVIYREVSIDFGTVSQDTMCTNASPILLGNGSPAGGVYSGPGIAADQFDPAIAGPGMHLLLYTYTHPIGCTASDSALFFVDACAGLNEVPDFIHFQIHPNPFTDAIQLSCSYEKLSTPEIVIYDQSGRIVLQQKIRGASTVIQLGHVARGAYLLDVLDDHQQIYHERLLKL